MKIDFSETDSMGTPETELIEIGVDLITNEIPAILANRYDLRIKEKSEKVFQIKVIFAALNEIIKNQDPKLLKYEKCVRVGKDRYFRNFRGTYATRLGMFFRKLRIGFLLKKSYLFEKSILMCMSKTKTGEHK